MERLHKCRKKNPLPARLNLLFCCHPGILNIAVAIETIPFGTETVDYETKSEACFAFCFLWPVIFVALYQKGILFLFYR